MDIRLQVMVDGMYWSGGACIKVPEVQEKCFEPMKTCDEPIIRFATGEISTEEARVVIRTRENAAELLAKSLAELIIYEMSKNDTHDGYPKHDREWNAERANT